MTEHPDDALVAELAEILDGDWQWIAVPEHYIRDNIMPIITRERDAAKAEGVRIGLALFQLGVDDWMDACFGAAIKVDRLERAGRFCEEALELCQTAPGFSKDRAHALVDYVFGRPQGEISQEVGGVMVTLAAFCNTFGISITAEAERELARVWTKVEQIRAKQATKPTGSALPIAQDGQKGATPHERRVVSRDQR